MLYEINQSSYVAGRYFISGKGCAEVNNKEEFFAGLSRDKDPYIELTVMLPDIAIFQQCLQILTPQNLVKNEITISGDGYFMSQGEGKSRSLGVFRLDSLTDCKLDPRR